MRIFHNSYPKIFCGVCQVFSLILSQRTLLLSISLLRKILLHKKTKFRRAFNDFFGLRPKFLREGGHKIFPGGGAPPCVDLCLMNKKAIYCSMNKKISVHFLDKIAENSTILLRKRNGNGNCAPFFAQERKERIIPHF